MSLFKQPSLPDSILNLLCNLLNLGTTATINDAEKERSSALRQPITNLSFITHFIHHITRSYAPTTVGIPKFLRRGFGLRAATPKIGDTKETSLVCDTDTTASVHTSHPTNPPSALETPNARVAPRLIPHQTNLPSSEHVACNLNPDLSPQQTTTERASPNERDAREDNQDRLSHSQVEVEPDVEADQTTGTLEQSLEAQTVEPESLAEEEQEATEEEEDEVENDGWSERDYEDDSQESDWDSEDDSDYEDDWEAEYGINLPNAGPLKDVPFPSSAIQVHAVGICV